MSLFHVQTTDLSPPNFVQTSPLIHQHKNDPANLTPWPQGTANFKT